MTLWDATVTWSSCAAGPRTFEPEEIIDAGNDRVVGITRWHGTGKGSRVPVEMRIGAVYTLKGGRLVRADLFTEPHHALQAVGLRE